MRKRDFFFVRFCINSNQLGKVKKVTILNFDLSLGIVENKLDLIWSLTALV